MAGLYVGLISGTSMDGVDAVLAEFGEHSVSLGATLTYPYPEPLRAAIERAARQPQRCSLDGLGVLDRQVGSCFRDAALALLREAGTTAGSVTAIGSHGQTLRHRPDLDDPYSLQIGDPATIALGTGITTVADFRRADIAAGGQGAPLVPPFHDWLFRRRDRDRVVLNLGGIANVTVLPRDGSALTGFDTGPGNTLMDAWCERHRGSPYDAGGEWAASGRVDAALLQRLCDDPYFDAPPPKSTGFEYFNPDWVERADLADIEAADVQATLCELTAATVARAIRDHAPATTEVLVCGGGSHNRHLVRRLGEALPGVGIGPTGDGGPAPDWVEAAAFAWLAARTLAGQPGNAPTVTGAGAAVILGAIHRVAAAEQPGRR